MKKQPHPQSVAGVCQRHNISPQTFYRQVRSGALRITKIGARTIVQPEDERAWLDSMRDLPLLPPRQERKTKALESENPGVQARVSENVTHCGSDFNEYIS